MNRHIADALRRDFPHLTADYGGDPAQTCMSDGFAIDDGWEPLLRQLLTEIDRQRAALPAAEAEAIRLFQVKEKWGGMRVYLTHATDKMRAALDRAERASFGICERCGATGEDVFPQGGWVKTLCPECRGVKPA